MNFSLIINITIKIKNLIMITMRIDFQKNRYRENFFLNLKNTYHFVNLNFNIILNKKINC